MDDFLNFEQIVSNQVKAKSNSRNKNNKKIIQNENNNENSISSRGKGEILDYINTNYFSNENLKSSYSAYQNFYSLKNAEKHVRVKIK